MPNFGSSGHDISRCVSWGTSLIYVHYVKQCHLVEHFNVKQRYLVEVPHVKWQLWDASVEYPQIFRAHFNGPSVHILEQ